VAQFAVGETALEQLSNLEPIAQRELAETAQRHIGEALALCDQSAPLPIHRTENIAETCASIERGEPATAPQLRDAARVIEQALRLRAHTKYHVDLCPELEQLLLCAPELAALRERIVHAIDDNGNVLDSASQGVRNARRALSHVRDELRKTSQGLVARYKESLSGLFVAERSGRFVLPVRTDAPNKVPGMILGTSGSGGSLYIEPAELSELNNRVYLREAELLREEAKVLAELSSAAADSVQDLRVAADNCTRADTIAAIARWAVQTHAKPVKFSEELVLDLRQMRHPLLIGEDQEVVPNDLLLEAGSCLVVSGPNAGGKTVSLKCFGLAVWMARSGLPIPCAEESRIGWFEDVLTDIGDEQSISRSLSTFSAHVTRLADTLQRAERGTLILLDEVAGGTDPDEGAALAEAVLRHLAERGAAVATTTHYEKLKQLAANEPEHFANASVGFDLQTMRPTFSVSLGVPGQSSALAVAERFGIPPRLVERAREALPKEQVQQQRLLEQVEAERAELHRLRAEAEEELATQQRLSRKMQAETERAREVERDRLAKEAQALTREVTEARALVRRAKAQLGSPQTSDALKRAEDWVSSAAQPVTIGGALTRALSKDDDGNHLDSSTVTPGLRVRIPHLKSDGEVLTLPQKGTVRVSVGGLKMVIPLEKLRAVRPPAAITARARQKTAPSPKRPARPAVSAAEAELEQQSSFTPSKTSANTCDLRGMRVEEGLDQIDGFIDRMLQAGEPAVFFLHGHGTGAMKDAVREYVAKSAHVARWERAAPEDGGDALTLCWL
jgi:DNA mismatch repair protein MutS2